jgi:hypothetical protein
MKMRSLFLLAAFVVGFAGCASVDLATDPALTSVDRQLASTMAELTQRICTHHTYEEGSNRKLSGDMKFHAAPSVKRLYRSDTGWVKADLQYGNVWDSVYHLKSTGTTVCGEIQWQKFSNSKAVQFTEIGISEKTLQTASVIEKKAAVEPAPTRQDDVRPIALRWDGYSRLISGTVLLLPGGQRGSIRASLPDADGTCTGIFEFTSAKGGQWAMSCTTGLAASGKFEALENARGLTGSGTDTKGNAVAFTVGAVSQ